MFDAVGHEVSTLVAEELSAGLRSYPRTADGLASGIFICRLQAGSFVEIKKFILLDFASSRILQSLSDYF